LYVSNYSTLGRRAQSLEVQLPIVGDGERIHLAANSTDAKAYREGEWKVR